MSIGQIQKTNAPTPVGPDERKTTAAGKKAPTPAQPAPAEASAQVELSPAASALSNASEDPSFDSAKVEALAQAIKDGKFTVNHGAIADKLIANAQELLGRTNSH